MAQLRDVANKELAHGRGVGRAMIERAMQMRAVAYAADVKARLLKTTMYQVEAKRRLLAALQTDGAEQVVRDFEAMRRRAERAEAKLRDALASRAMPERYDQLLELFSDALVVLDEDRRVTFATASCGPLFGEAIEQLVGSPIRDVLRGLFDDAATNLELSTALARGEAWAGSIAGRRRDGTPLSLQLKLAPLEMSGELALVLRDTTAATEWDRHRHQSQRIYALGLFTGGVVHDLNNLLTAIFSNAFVARAELHNPPVALACLDDVHEVASAARDLLVRLLTFVRDDATHDDVLELGDLLSETLRITGPSLAPHVKVALERRGGPVFVRADAIRVNQIVINLLSNASDATAGREDARITLRLSHVPIDSPIYTRRPALRGRRLAQLEVVDNGDGIPAAMLASVLQPFVTTKSPGKGTGLGLAIVREAVTSIGGSFELDSEVGRGTTARVLLPALPVPALDQRSEAPEPATELPVAPWRALLVHAHEPVRRSIARALRLLGAHVLQAQDADEALACFGDPTPAMDVVLIDQHLAPATGAALARRLRALHADIPLVLLANTNVDPNLIAEIAGAAPPLLMYPFDVPSLRRALTATMDTPARST